jgi:hypothetical protein
MDIGFSPRGVDGHDHGTAPRARSILLVSESTILEDKLQYLPRS